MHVLFISSWYPTRKLHMNGNFTVKHAESVAQFEDVSFLHVAQDVEIKQDFTVNVFIENNVHHFLYYYKGINIPFLKKIINFIIRIFLYIKGFKHITQQRSKPSLVHLNIISLIGYIAYIYKIFFKIPYVISEHWSGMTVESNFHINKIHLFFIRIWARNSSFIFPVTIHLAKSMQKLKISGNYHVIPNVVETEIFSIKNKTINSSTKKRILHVSSLDPKPKNFTGILNVIQKISAIRNDFELLVVSSQSHHAKVAKKAVIDRGLSNIILFEGSKTPPEIAEIMQQSDFFLLFSKYENLPCVIVESMACGLPVISSNVGGISEHLDETKGILVPKLDENALFNAVMWMLDNYDKFNKEQMRQYAIDNFSYNHVGKKFISMYKQIIK